MDKNPIQEFIARLPFFKEFSDTEREKLVNASGIFEKFKIDEVIISEGDMDASVFVILTGAVKIKKKPKIDLKENHISLQDPEEITIAELKAGSIFGEISLISKHPRNTSAIASAEQVVLMKITNEIIEKFNLAIQKKFQNQLIHILVQRLDDMNTKYIKLKASASKN
ncbi:MAG: cyclic nucleotide-binding domain-containing protein [Nitrospinae bacterium]|nr:cyclic nucleotide-binding domain-containing protein [Nitrospinota bacterium]